MGEMIVVSDLSNSGMKIRHLMNQVPENGETLMVGFHLDNNERSYVRRSVIVKRVDGDCLDVEIVPEQQYDALGPYMLFNCGTVSKKVSQQFAAQ